MFSSHRDDEEQEHEVGLQRSSEVSGTSRDPTYGSLNDDKAGHKPTFQSQSAQNNRINRQSESKVSASRKKEKDRTKRTRRDKQAIEKKGKPEEKSAGTRTRGKRKRRAETSSSPKTSSSSSHWKSTLALCCCTLTHSYLLISVFPYSGFLAVDLVPNLNEENAGSYAGFIASSFMIGRAVTSYWWGRMADTYGRTTVLQASLALSSLFTLFFGMAQNFACALAFRFLLGLGNGMISTAKTAVSELAHGNEKLETRGMGLVMGMWGWGFLVSPAIGGALAEPVRQYPHSRTWRNIPWCYEVLTRHPFLLPNVVGVVMCALTMISVWAWVDETLPKVKRRDPHCIPGDFRSWLCAVLTRCCWKSRRWDSSSKKDETLPLLAAPESSISPADVTPTAMRSDASKSLSHSSSSRWSFRTALAAPRSIRLTPSSSSSSLSSYFSANNSPSPSPQLSKKCQSNSSAFEELCETTITAKPTIKSILARKSTRWHLYIYWIYSFVSIAVDEAFPLFCMSKDAGLGLSESSIGTILSVSGVLFALCQYGFYVVTVHRFGLYPSMYLSLAIGGLVVGLIPLSLFMNQGHGANAAAANIHRGKLTWPVIGFLSFIVGAKRIFGSIFFSSISIALNKTVPATERGTMNGLSMLGGSAAKGIGPIFAGTLSALSFSKFNFRRNDSGQGRTSGAVLVFVFLAALGGLVCLCAFFFLTDEQYNCSNEDTIQIAIRAENVEEDNTILDEQSKEGDSVKYVTNGHDAPHNEEVGEKIRTKKISRNVKPVVNTDKILLGGETNVSAVSGDALVEAKQTSQMCEMAMEVKPCFGEKHFTGQQTTVIDGSINEKRSATASSTVDLSGNWALVVSGDFKRKYDLYLQSLQKSFLIRRAAVALIGMTTEETRQIDCGRTLLIRSCNARGVWERALIASDSDESRVLVDVKNADNSETLQAEAWWEKDGTVHTSWLRGGTVGDFESRRYLGEGGNVLLCESIFHPRGGCEDQKAFLTWKFTRCGIIAEKRRL